ncbi:MAG: PEGA domain-containing protein [Parcubacteria group bacterium]
MHSKRIITVVGLAMLLFSSCGHMSTGPESSSILPEPGTLYVWSTPEGAQVFLDGHATGLITPATFVVSEGRHVVHLEMSGYADWTEVMTYCGEWAQLHARLLPLVGSDDATAWVISLDPTS